jgi:hypothetical protein
LIFRLHARPKISTEADIEGAPVAIRLRVRPNAKPGHYSVPLAFTYFDGTQWKSSSASADFVVRSWFQRNEVIIFSIAVISAVATVIALVK